MPETESDAFAADRIQLEDRWGAHNYRPRDEAEIIVCENNFHGREPPQKAA